MPLAIFIGGVNLSENSNFPGGRAVELVDATGIFTAWVSKCKYSVNQVNLAPGYIIRNHLWREHIINYGSGSD